MLTKGALRSKVLLVFAILIALNFLVNFMPSLRFDFTGDGRYTLSDATKKILTDLDGTVNITAYFSENLPPQFQSIRSDFEDLLVEYNQRSGGAVVYTFKNPNESEEDEQAAVQDGIQPRNIQVRQRDQMSSQRAYMGAKLEYGDTGDSEVIAAVDPGAAMEYALSSSIKKISVANKPKIGFIGGHGEAALATMPQVQQSLEILYEPVSVLLTDTALNDFKALAIIAPKDSFKTEEFAALDKFLASGKGVLVALNRVDANLQTASGTDLTTGLEVWLEEKGVRVNADFVVDNKCSGIMVQDPRFLFPRQVRFPYLPLIQTFNDHPITRGLEQLVLPFASSMMSTEKSGIKFSPIATTSALSGTEQPPITFDVQREWTNSDFITTHLTVAGTLEGNLVGNTPAKMVVYGDGDFAVNGEGRQAQQLAPDNVNFFVNGIDWLSDDTGLTDLRTKGITSRPIEKELSDGEKTFVKFGNFLLPIALILGYGLIRYQGRQRKRRQRQAADYS